jgi:hypothetical protein
MIIPDGGFKRRSRPEFEGIDRLSIEMTIDQDSGLVVRMKPLTIYDRVTFSRKYPNVLNAGHFKPMGNPFSRTYDIISILGQTGDAGDAKKLLELFDVSIFVII